MKFYQKLSQLRKKNNFSQEQFADKLNVSRQAVSKWESGASYPDMEKILSMCNILNCNLDELLDDGVINSPSANKSNKFKIEHYLRMLLSFINQTFNMFSSMKFKQTIKCILELFTTSLILFILSLVIYNIFNLIPENIFYILPDFIYSFITRILKIISIVFLFIISCIILIHLFKTRYLNYYITIEDKTIKEKTIEKELNELKLPNNKEKIIIRDPKDTSFSLINFFAKPIIFLIKTCAWILVLSFICIFIFSISLFIILLLHSTYGSIFLFSALLFLAVSLISYLIFYYFSCYIFSKLANISLIFKLFVVSFVTIGISLGLIAINILNFEKQTDLNQYITETTFNDIVIDKNLFFGQDVEFIIDNNLNNLSVSISHFKFTKPHWYSMGEEIYFTQSLNNLDLYKTILKDIKNKKLPSYDEIGLDGKIKVYLTEEQYNRININKNNYLNTYYN